MRAGIAHLVKVWFVVINATFLLNVTFNNSSVVISWQSVLFVEETRVPRENY